MIAHAHRELGNVEGVSFFSTPSNIRHSYYRSPVRLGDTVDEDKVAGILRQDYDIETGNAYYPPCHLNPFYEDNFGTRRGDLPVSEQVLKKVLCLPMHSSLTEENVRYVAKAFSRSVNKLQVEG